MSEIVLFLDEDLIVTLITFIVAVHHTIVFRLFFLRGSDRKNRCFVLVSAEVSLVISTVITDFLAFTQDAIDHLLDHSASLLRCPTLYIISTLPAFDSFLLS